ncbi:4,5-dioxygenase, partial [Burkholderia multivorans]|nr:4,5-dioxygenase [Burkholderia multivorans]
MDFIDVNAIRNWHAHVYFDAAGRDAAWTFRQTIEARFGAIIELGRFHER